MGGGAQFYLSKVRSITASSGGYKNSRILAELHGWGTWWAEGVVVVRLSKRFWAKTTEGILFDL